MPNRYECSNGRMVTQGVIDAKRSESYREKYEGVSRVVCACCNQEQSRDSDHTIAQARCKEIHKTELIWHKENYCRSCPTCHSQWESYKSGEYLSHLNVLGRLIYMATFDQEGLRIRLHNTNHPDVMKYLYLIEEQ